MYPPAHPLLSSCIFSLLLQRMKPAPPQIPSPLTIQEQCTSNSPLFCVINFLFCVGAITSGILFPSTKKQDSWPHLFFQQLHHTSCSLQQPIELSVFSALILSLHSPLAFVPSSIKISLSEVTQWLYMANPMSPHLTGFQSFICVHDKPSIIGFQDTRISISRFTSDSFGHSCSAFFLVLLHFPAPYVLDCPRIRILNPLFTYLTWFLHLMSNRRLKFNLSQTEPLIFSFKIRSPPPRQSFLCQLMASLLFQVAQDKALVLKVMSAKWQSR